MLLFKRFIPNKDEEDWIKILNNTKQGLKDIIPLSKEYMKKEEESPNFSPEGMFFAEKNGEVIGCVDTYIDTKYKPIRGVILDLAVIPECRRQGFGKIILTKAIEDLKNRGARYIEVSLRTDWLGCKYLYEAVGFKRIRIFSLMKRDLKHLPTIRKNKNITFRMMENNRSDIVLCNSLSNKIFKEDFNFRKETLEETEFYLINHPSFDVLRVFFAYLEQIPVGLVTAGFNSDGIKIKGNRSSVIVDLGVLHPYRRQGIGKTLLLKALEFLKNEQMEEVELEVDDLNVFKANNLYEKMGFRTKSNYYVYKLAYGV